MSGFFDSHWILTFLIFFPLLGALAAYLAGEHGARRVALGVGVVEFLASVPLFFTVKGAGTCAMSGVTGPSTGASPSIGRITVPMQNCADFAWFPDWGIHYRIGIDGISLFMVLLTTLLLPLMVLGSWSYVRDRQAAFYALLLALTTGVVGVFVALDLFLFYVFWEVMLIPMYFLIGIWGGKERIYAAVKFFLYTVVGSLLMLVAILYLHWRAKSLGTMGAATFSYWDFTNFGLLQLSGMEQSLLFLAFALAFAIKVPIFPFHTWLPHAHVQAPTAGSVVLAGVLLKMGTYGFIRFALPLFPDVARASGVVTWAMVLGVVGIVYAAMVAAVQPNAKKLVAYTSVAHLGFVILGIFAGTLQGMQGALLVMIGHGLSTPMLFFLLGMLYERRHTYEIEDFGGLSASIPVFSTLLVVAAMATIGLPTTSGFVSEFLVLVGTFEQHPWMALVAATGVIIAAYYMLPMVQRMVFNPLDRPANRGIPDLGGRELAVLLPLVALIFWLGLYPKPFLDRMEPAARRIVATVRTETRLPARTFGPGQVGMADAAAPAAAGER
ncbi:MAG TPA: NADH-quinone oxidoreductase subunit M [Longimicrobiaceae bacterium]|nr:NADH-quinone oxidoreductase subunit M [Longimicrobiaceae bacterium]